MPNRTSGADLLRKAAAGMRERARAAAQAPWFVSEDAMVSNERDLVAVTVGGRHMNTQLASAKHVASWHPAVALTVADWLDAEAKLLDEEDWDAADESPEALAVASAYLGRTDA